MNEEIFELQVFDLTTAALAEMKTSFMALKVCGVDDSEGFDQVHAARMIVKKTRVQVEKRGLELRKKKKQEIEDYLRSVSETEKFIVGELFPVETYLQSQEDIITQEKARLKAEADEKEAARLAARVQRLCDFGCQFNGQAYTAFGLSIPVPILKVSTDEQFDGFCQQIAEKATAEQLRIKAEEDARKTEAERIAKIAAEQETERQRLEEIARKQAEESARIKDEQKQIADAKQKVLDDAKHAQELEEIRIKAVEQARIDVEAKIKRQVEEKAAADLRAKIEAEKKAARAPDKEKLLGFVIEFECKAKPDFRTQEARTILDEFLNGLSILTKTLREKAEAL